MPEIQICLPPSMVQFCCVISCGNRSNREQKKFYRLPNISKTCDRASYKADIVLRRRKQWLLNIGRADLKDGDEAYSPGYIRVCSDHFVGGKPSAWSDVDNIDWAPTVQMGCGFKSSQRKKPHKNTAEKRAMRIQELQKKKMMLGLGADAKPGKMAEKKGEVIIKKEASTVQAKGASSSGGTKQGKGKKIAAKGKIVKVKGLKGKSGLLEGSKQSKAPRKKVKASKKPEPTPTYSFQIQRMLKKQEIKVRRKILELELSGSNQSYGKPKVEKVTVNPIIHRITLDSIPLAPEDSDSDVKINPESTDYKVAELIIVPETKEGVVDTKSEEMMDVKPEEVVDTKPEEMMDIKPEEVVDTESEEVVDTNPEVVVKEEDQN